MKRHDRIFDIALSLLVGCGACASSPPIPLTLRPDTRRIAAVQIDSATMAVILGTFRTAFPKEAALCLLGVVRDTTLDLNPWLVVRVTSAIPAQADSADAYHVFFSKPPSGCERPGLVGAAHDHTVPTTTCTHSYSDANLVFADRRLLFSVVFCSDGWAESLYQDGRRVLARWTP